MAQLKVYGQEIETFYELVGRGKDEDDMTYNLGWALAECKSFCQSFAKLLGITDGFSDEIKILLQKHSSVEGIKSFTDIELIDSGKYHIIIEAKRGFNVPSEGQLKKYASRLDSDKTEARKILVVLAESDRKNKWLSQQVPELIQQIPVKAISWREVKKVAHESSARSRNHAEKLLLKELVEYLGKVTTPQNQYSNMVRVFPLRPGGGNLKQKYGISFLDVVKAQLYYHPMRELKEPPNYIAFRYAMQSKSMLQSIHYVESYEVIKNFRKVIKNFRKDFDPPKDCEPHYLFYLGPPIEPAHEIRTLSDEDAEGFGNYNKHECFIDLLLTCKSVQDAVKKTEERQTSWAMEDTN